MAKGLKFLAVKTRKVLTSTHYPCKELTKEKLDKNFKKLIEILINQFPLNLKFL